MKNIKRKIIYILIFMFLPLINVKANTVSLKLECPKEAIPGNDIICTLNGVAEEVKITSLSTKITVEGNMEFVSFNNESSWNLTTEDEGIINLTSESRKTGNFKIGTITLKAKNNEDDAKSSISFMNNIFYSDNSSELTILPISKTIRIHSTNNKLHTIFLSTEPLSPAFDKEITTYTATTNNDTITINASPESKYSIIIGTGKKELSYGVNDFEIKVVAEDGTKKIYKLHINRLEKVLSKKSNTNTVFVVILTLFLLGVIALLSAFSDSSLYSLFKHVKYTLAKDKSFVTSQPVIVTNLMFGSFISSIMIYEISLVKLLPIFLDFKLIF